MMYRRGKSSPVIVAGKPANKAQPDSVTAAGSVERRAGAKGNANQPARTGLSAGSRVVLALASIRQAAMLDCQYPRWEPYAGKLHVRVCAGGARQLASRPRLLRREFITLLGGAVAWPLIASAQQGNRVRRIGVLMPIPAEDQNVRDRLAAFRQALQGHGWMEGLNVEIDTRATGDRELLHQYAAELVALAPDVILAGSGLATEVLQQATRTVPIVFASTVDPARYVKSLSRPGGNITGFSNIEFDFTGKYLELLKEISPFTTRA